MSDKEMRALEEKDIHVGDTVRTAYRGGVREGTVKKIATTKEEHPHPPKVIFDRERPGQAPKEVAHNPSTLEKVAGGAGKKGKGEEEETGEEEAEE